MSMKNRPPIAALAACALWSILAVLAMPAAAADAVFPTASRLGLVPPAGLEAATTFPGFEDNGKTAFIRLIALPQQAFAEIDKTMTNDALKKQGMVVEKRETLKFPAGNAILVLTRQETPVGRIRKWLLIAPLEDLTAMVSFEMQAKTPPAYSDDSVRKAFATLTTRATVPDNEQLMLVPFRISDTAGLRLVRVVPGVAAQFTDGPKDTLEALDQPQLIIAAAGGGPQQTGDRDQFARNALSGLPPMKDVRIASSESMRIGGQPGHEIRALGKDAQTGAEIEIVQWLRFGTGAYLRILGLAPKESWTEAFTRFRAVRDGLEPR
jgi:hypothetical protein